MKPTLTKIYTLLFALLTSGFLTFASAQTKPVANAAPAASANKSALPAGVVGTVDLLSGTVTVTTLKGVSREIVVGMPLEAGDTIKTSDESEAHANMADGAYLAVRANSTIKITAYAANGNIRDRSWIDVVTGSLRTVTGWIAKTRPKGYRINTPTATIGVRGTDHEVIYFRAEDAETEAEAGTHNVVYEGATTMETPKGRVNIGQGQAAYVPIDAFAPKIYTGQLPVFLVRARGQFDNDVVEHRMGLDAIMQRSLMERGLMRDGQNLQDIFKRIGGEGFVPGGGAGLGSGLPGQNRAVQGVQSDILNQTFGGPGNTKGALPVPFGLPGGSGNPNAPPPMGLPLPGAGAGSGGGGMPFIPR